MRKLLAVLTITLLFGCGNVTGGEKSINELKYDSLVSVISQQLPLLKETAETSKNDSIALFYDDLTNLDYPSIKNKYLLNDSEAEQEFLHTLNITAQIARAITELENKKKSIMP